MKKKMLLPAFIEEPLLISSTVNYYFSNHETHFRYVYVLNVFDCLCVCVRVRVLYIKL